jgi:hypothetical protein
MRLGLAAVTALAGAGCAAHDPLHLPPRTEAEHALAMALLCLDEDGYTDCLLLPAVRSVSLGRLACRPAPARGPEHARAECRLRGRMTYATGAVRPLPAERAMFVLVDGAPAGRGRARSWQVEGPYP